MKKIKILQFSKFYPPAVGGIEQVVHDIVKGNANTSLHDDVLCFNHEIGANDEIICDNNHKIMRMHTYKIIASTPLSLNILKKFMQIKNDYDYIHFHVPNPIATIASLFVRRNKYVVHWHSDIVKQKKLFFFFKPLQQIMLNRAAKIVVTSDEYAAKSEQLRNYSNKTLTIPIGIFPSKKPVNEPLLGKLKGQYKSKKVIFSLGRLAYYKGFEYLIRSSKYLNDDAVIIIGGSGELKEELNQLIKTIGVEDKVVLAGRINDEDLSTYYSFADIFCMPSIEKSEAFGVVQLEAMLYGLPIVSTRIPGSGVDWVNANGVSGITVQPKDEVALAEAFNNLLQDKQLMDFYSVNSFNRLLELFTVEKMCARLNEMYINLEKGQKEYKNEN